MFKNVTLLLFIPQMIFEDICVQLSLGPAEKIQSGRC